MSAVQEFRPYRTGVPPLRDYAASLWRRRDFIVEYADSMLKVQHAGTILGRLWLLATPLFLAIVYYVLVLVLARKGEPNSAYFLRVLSGVFAFYMFSTAMSAATPVIANGGNLVLNQRFPRLVLPLAVVVVALRRFVPALALVLIAHLVLLGWPSPTMLAAIPAFVLLLFVTTGAAVLSSVAQVYMRDTATIVPMVSRLALYLSPVLYPPDAVPAGLLWLLQWNPLFWTIGAWTGAMSGTYDMTAQTWALATFMAVAVLTFALWVFLRRERDFAVHV